MRQIGLDVFGALGAHRADFAQVFIENLAVQEQQGRESLILSAGRNLFLERQVSQELFDFRRSHLGGVAEAVEADEAAIPVYISGFGARGVGPTADSSADLVFEFHVDFSG